MAARPVTFVNVFDVDPAKHIELAELLREALEQVIQHRAGFVSGRLLVASGGARVISEVDWASREAVEATHTDREVGVYARRAADLASASPSVYSIHTQLEA